MAEEIYAYIIGGQVINTAVFDNPTTEILNVFKEDLGLDEIVLSTPKTIIGGTYDGSKFWFPQPHPSWIKNEETNEWEAPVPEPEFDEQDPKGYVWNEETLSWRERQFNE
jgi:hypothetical protein